MIIKNPSKFLGNEELYLKKVLNSDSWSATGGTWTEKLEEEFAKKFHSEYAIAFNSGTSTMHAALLAFGVKPGDEVISPSISVIMNASTTVHANAIPVFADVNEDTFTIDPFDIERKITKKTKAIMVVSVYGLPCNMDEITSIGNKYGIPVLEDNAECFLSTYKGKMTGTIGDMGSYSFEDSKHMSCGEGGMLITNDENLALKARKIGNHGFRNLKSGSGRIKQDMDVFQNPNFKRHDQIGWNYRLPEFNSAIALAQLERLEELIQYRVKTAEIFLDVISNCDYLVPQITPKGYTNSYWALGVKYTGEEVIGLSWQDFRKEYIKAGGDGFYGAWSVPYNEPVFKSGAFKNVNPDIYEKVSYKNTQCPIAEKIQKQLMVFKTNYRSIKYAEKKAKSLKGLIKKYKA